ncbi:MAG: DEAD/DEAH box helicase [Gemmatimonadales bacterium]
MSGTSGAFALLHPRIQQWVYAQGWPSLRDAQERAVAPILSGRLDLIIAAATAAGKTEAAFLPICSALAGSYDTSAAPGGAASDADGDAGKPGGGIDVLYISPLKALINDQFDRLELLCQSASIPVHRWHGDVGAGAKQNAARNPSGILIITPESLEARFVNHGTAIAPFFAGLRYVVIDELHVFLSSPRGAQLQSLLNRVERAIGRRVPRIGLSATLGDLGMARQFIRPTDPQGVEVIETSHQQDIKLQVRGYLATAPREPTEEDATAEASGGAEAAIVDHLFRTLRGEDNLVFANSRQNVEMYADQLRIRCEAERLPNEFLPHHGNLAKDVREDVEAMLKDRTLPVTAICTSTLEMGIDIGSVASIAQIGVPPSVAALRQRLGRSGRRGGPPVLRVYVKEDQLTKDSSPVDQLRCDIVEVVAMVQLLLARWLEPPDDPGFNYSTLVQQILSSIAQLGGARALDLRRMLCQGGPFDRVDERRFVALLRAMAEKDLVVQSSDGTLLHGPAGERFVNHYSFFAAFATSEEWRLMAGGRTLGTLPIEHPLSEGGLLIFAGRRWRIASIDEKAKVLDLVRAPGGLLPMFGGTGRTTGDTVRQEMRRVLEGVDSPIWLDQAASRLLGEGRSAWRRLGLADTPLIPVGRGSMVFPWMGDRALTTAAQLLSGHGLPTDVEGPALMMQKDPPERVAGIASDILDAPLPDPVMLAGTMKNGLREKWDWVLGGDLLAEAMVAQTIDMAGAERVLRAIAAGPMDTLG